MMLCLKPYSAFETVPGKDGNIRRPPDLARQTARWLLLAAALLLPPEHSAAELPDHAGPEPRVCTGYNPETASWGPVGVQIHHHAEGYCPRGYAYFSLAHVSGKVRPARKIPVRGICCPVPADLLTETHRFELERCGPGFVATGARSGGQITRDDRHLSHREMDRLWETFDQYLRCTAINTERYRLAEPRRGVALRWGRHIREYFSRGTALSRVPAALRYGVTREGRRRWANFACLGYPWGSLLVGKEDKFCGFLFSELQYRGAPGDPPAGTPVPMYPHCRAVRDVFDPDPECLR